MFKMCFRTQRAQKIYSKKNFFLSTMKNWVLEHRNFFDVPKKKSKNNVCLKYVLGPIESKKLV